MRLIGDDGEMLGVVTIAPGAAPRPRTAGLDLVEISPNADPPVCKILDYGKFKYEAQKKANEARKKQKTIDVKEIKMRPGIDEHDYDVKMKAMHKFLDEGDKVKVTDPLPRPRDGPPGARPARALNKRARGDRRDGQGRGDPQDGRPPDDHGDRAALSSSTSSLRVRNAGPVGPALSFRGTAQILTGYCTLRGNSRVAGRAPAVPVRRVGASPSPFMNWHVP